MTPLGPSPTVQASRLKRLIKSLMDIYSPSGKEEELVDFLFGYCRKRGLPAVRQEVDDGRHNLLLLPPDGSMEWALIGHLDTVSAYDLEDYGFREEDERILGLGAADMKAGCAAMVEAFSTAWEKLGSRVNCGVFLVVGEEEEGDGAKALVEEYHVPWAIIGEPTCLKPCLGQYGYIEVQILCTGRRVHASLASQVRSPVETMMVAVSELTKYLRVSRPEVVFNIRDLFSGPGGFAVPERCEAWIDLHMPPWVSAGELLPDIEEIVSRVGEGEKPKVRFSTVHGGYQLLEKGPFVGALKETYRKLGLPWEPEPFPSHSDASVLWGAGIQSVVLGPGSLEQAHAPEEWVEFSQVKKAAEIYLHLILALAKGEEKSETSEASNGD
jgi:acetylornithine deacetylase